MTAFVLSPQHDALVAAYEGDLRTAGIYVDSAVLWGGRAFCVRFGDADGWNAAPLREQLACNVKIHRFVAWLAATRRLRPCAARKLRQPHQVARRRLAGLLAASRNRLATTSGLKPGWSRGYLARSCSSRLVRRDGGGQ